MRQLKTLSLVLAKHKQDSKHFISEITLSRCFFS